MTNALISVKSFAIKLLFRNKIYTVFMSEDVILMYGNAPKTLKDISSLLKS